MNPRRILAALAVALCFSVGATWFISHRLALTVHKAPDRHYVVPARDVQAGEVLKPEDLAVVVWPASAPIDEAYTRTEDVIGREALFPLAKGEPLINRALSTPGSGTGLASKIPEGMRAVTLRSNEVIGVAGFLIPGSHLDVLVTYRAEKVPDPMTATVLQNASVIAVGHQIQPDPQGKPSDVAVVTLLLTPEDAERAVLASNQGVIHFVLRNGADPSRATPPPLVLSELAADPIAAPHATARAVPAAAPAAPRPREPEIEIVLGGVK